jgi:uncharacterized protein
MFIQKSLRFLPLVSLLCFAAPCLPVGISYKSDAKLSYAKTLLWEISGNGLARPSYVFGTMHIGCPKSLILSKQQKKAMDNVEQLFLEVDRNYVSNNIIPNGKTLQDLMSAEEYNKVKTFFANEHKNFPAENFNEYNRTLPKSLADGVITNDRLVTAYSEYCKVHKKDLASKEEMLLEAADQRKISTFGIETLQDRKDSEKDVEMRDQVIYLLMAIELYQMPEYAKTDKQVREAEMKYLDQDIESFALSDDTFFVRDRVNSPPAFWRNRLWIPRMRIAMHKKPTFFGFGASHLGGSKGLLALLEAEGYKLKPIFDSGK